MSRWNQVREASKKGGRYTKGDECPRCKKTAVLEPAYPVSDGGQVRDDSPWAGNCLCSRCIKAEMPGVVT